MVTDVQVAQKTNLDNNLTGGGTAEIARNATLQRNVPVGGAVATIALHATQNVTLGNDLSVSETAEIAGSVLMRGSLLLKDGLEVSTDDASGARTIAYSNAFSLIGANDRVACVPCLPYIQWQQTNIERYVPGLGQGPSFSPLMKGQVRQDRTIFGSS